jgi:hypothetical protein
VCCCHLELRRGGVAISGCGIAVVTLVGDGTTEVYSQFVVGRNVCPFLVVFYLSVSRPVANAMSYRMNWISTR